MQHGQQFDQQLRDFLDGQGGRLVVLSDDVLFVRTLRNTLTKLLAVKGNCMEACADASKALKALRECMSANASALVMADRLLRGASTLEFLRAVKTVFVEAKLLVLTQETSREDLSQLYELGVDSIIIKPVSVDTLVEKMAGTIKPQGKISQLVQEARRLLAHKETDKVRGISRAILKIKENSPVAFMLEGDADLADGRREDAVRAYEAAHHGAALYLEPLKKLAEAYKGYDEDAYVRCLRKLDRISPLNVERKCELGKLYARKNDAVRAEAYFSAAVASARREAVRRVERVMAEIAESMMDVAPALAEKYYGQILDMKADCLTEADMATFNRLGIALRRQGKWREAVDDYKRALSIVPHDARVHYNMGLAYMDGRQFRLAVGAFELALRADPEIFHASAVSSYNIASAYDQAGEPDLARKYATAALELDPAHAPAARLLANLADAPARG